MRSIEGFRGAVFASSASFVVGNGLLLWSNPVILTGDIVFVSALEGTVESLLIDRQARQNGMGENLKSGKRRHNTTSREAHKFSL